MNKKETAIPTPLDIKEGELLLQKIIETTFYSLDNKNDFLKAKIPDEIHNFIKNGNIEDFISCFVWEYSQNEWHIGLCFNIYSPYSHTKEKKFIALDQSYSNYESAYRDMIDIVKKIIYGYHFFYLLKTKVDLNSLPDHFFFYDEKILLNKERLHEIYNVIVTSNFLPFYQPKLFEKEINRFINKVKNKYKHITNLDILTKTKYSNDILFYCYIFALSGYTRFPLSSEEKEKNIV